MHVLHRRNKKMFTRFRLTIVTKTTAAVVKVPSTQATAIPDTGNITATMLPWKPKQVGDKKDGGQTCHYCGYSSTDPTCPAGGQECRNCHKTNHFAWVCNSKPVRQICFCHPPVSPSTSSDESVFTVKVPTSPKTPKVTTLVNNTPVTFVLEMGACVNIISGRMYDSLRQRPAIHYTTTRLFAYRSKQAIPARGFINTTIKFQDKRCRLKMRRGSGRVWLGDWNISFGLRGPSPQAFTPFRGGLG